MAVDVPADVTTYGVVVGKDDNTGLHCDDRTGNGFDQVRYVYALKGTLGRVH